LLIEALKGIGVADNNLLGAHIKANSHNPTSPGAAWSNATSSRTV
jgi:hypothetical protein